MRLASLATLPLLIAGLAGCCSVPAVTPAPDDLLPAVAYQASTGTTAQDAGILDYAMVVPENAAYLPWKMVAGLGKGIVDGGAAGFEPHRLPILGLLFLPVNVAVGGVTGLVAGTVAEPGFVGPRASFGRTMGLPLQRRTPLWWLP